MVRNIYTNEIHLYSLIIPENFEGYSLKKCTAYLSDKDREKYSKLKVRDKKSELLVSRVFLWNVLGRYLAAKNPTTFFSIRKDDNGKPFLFLDNEPVPLYFNLSHTKDMISCVVSLHQPLGIDVEFMENKNVCFLEEYLSPVEKEQLQDTRSDDKAACLYALWTLKEAYLKADGRGLYVPLDSFGFIFDQAKTGDSRSAGIQIQFYHSIENQSEERWFFRSYQSTPRHSLAVAVRMEDAPLVRSFFWGLDRLNSFSTG